jgi:hypothetical protein
LYGTFILKHLKNALYNIIHPIKVSYLTCL